MVLVETLLDRGADDDLDEAKSAIERLAALAGNAGAVDNVIVLRLRALSCGYGRCWRGRLVTRPPIATIGIATTRSPRHSAWRGI